MKSSTRSDLLKLPNILSISRIGVAPVMVLILLWPNRFMSLLAAVVFVLVCITDWLDGYLARRSGNVTSIGKFLDPLADKILIMTALIMLIPPGRVPAWMVALIVGREIAVTGLRAVAAEGGILIPASPLGKFKTVLQIVALVPLLIHYPMFGVDFHFWGMVLLWMALAVTLLSGVDYFLKFFGSAEKA